jgi:hypothetical protein
MSSYVELQIPLPSYKYQNEKPIRHTPNIFKKQHIYSSFSRISLKIVSIKEDLTISKKVKVYRRNLIIL